MSQTRIKLDDEVLVISGKDKGKRGTVIRVLPGVNRVVVDGVNLVTRHIAARPGVTQTGIVQNEAPLSLSNVMLIDPETGKIKQEITGLTTAIDVAVDELGNIFVLEATSGFADPLPILFDLFDPNAEPLHGGYQRFDGRLTLYSGEGDRPIVLASGLDMPTNLELGPDGALYVSIGQGTPNRPIPGPDGPTRIVGQILRTTNMVLGSHH